MPRYFFHLHHSVVSLDRDGIDLASDVEAWMQGVRTCGQMLADFSHHAPVGFEYRMECVDEQRRSVFTIRFSAEAGLK